MMSASSLSSFKGIRHPIQLRCELPGGSRGGLAHKRVRVAAPWRASNTSDTQTSTTVQPEAALPVLPPNLPPVYRSLASLSSVSSVASLSSIDEFAEDDVSSFRFLPSQLEVFHELSNSMQNCSRGLSALAFGSVIMNAFEAVEHAHSHHHSEHVHAAAEVGASAVQGAAAQAAAAALPAVAEHATSTAASGMLFFEEWCRAISLTDVAFCVNELIPALLIVYAAAPFEQLAKNPDEPHMVLALRGVGRLSVTMQQLAWTSGSVAVVLLLTAAAEYPPLVKVASWFCIALAVARGASLWWVISQHTTSGEEVARTLAALRGGSGAKEMNPLDRAASSLALGVLLQAEERLHADHHRAHQHSQNHLQQHEYDMLGMQMKMQMYANSFMKGTSNGNGNGVEPADASAAAAGAPEAPSGALVPSTSAAGVAAAAGGGAAAAVAPLPKPHYSFDLEEERVLRSLVEGANTAGLAISLLVLATLALGLAEAAGQNSSGWVSSVILASQKAANALALYASATAFDRALHNDDGNDDTDHLLDGLGREHSGMTGLFNSMAVLSLALLMAGSVALLVPSLEESPLGVLVGDGVMHASADLLIEVLEMI